MIVVFFHRKPRPGVNFSIENLFKHIRNALSSAVEYRVKEMAYFSNGIFKRLYSGIEAACCQGDVNHITGDIHFLALFLKKKRTVLTIHDLGMLNHPNRLAGLLLKSNAMAKTLIQNVVQQLAREQPVYRPNSIKLQPP